MRPMSCARCRRTKSGCRARSSRFLWIFFGFALLVHLPLGTPEARAAGLVGSWTGETQFDTNGFSYTPGAGEDRIALIMITTENNGGTNPNYPDIGSVTLGGQTLTAIQNANGVLVGVETDYHNMIWLGYLDESEIGSMVGNTLSITWDQTPNTPFGETMVQAATYACVDQTTPIADSASNSNTSAASIQAGSVTVGASDRLVYVALAGQPGNHTAPGGYTEQIEQDGPANDLSNASVQRDVTTSGTENPTASWSLTTRLAIISAVLNASSTRLDLADHTAGQESDAFSESGSETDAELFAFELDPIGGSQTVTEIVFTISSITGLADGDWGGVEIIEDTNDDGNIGGSETTARGGAGVVVQAGGTITFSSSFTVTATTSYILRADFSFLSDGDAVTISLTASNITTTVCEGGSTTPVSHREVCEYVESFQTWTASSADTWQTQDLSGAPFNVPANSVVEVAVRNDATTAQMWGGVRAVGSTLERRFQLHEAEGGGLDIVVMHVQADAGSQIQHYSDVTADVDFVLLGYWKCGTYVEAFDTFTAGAGASWQDEDLCPYGVVPNGVAEIVMANTLATAQRDAGVRTNGSALARMVDIHEAEGGGVDVATMFVRADATAAATVELYAQVDADIDFYLVGYWSVAPLAYNELFVDVGSPSTDFTWQDLDLTASGVPDNAVAEFVMSNEDINEQNEMGVRANGSSLARILDLQEAESGGSDAGRMHVLTDGTSTIEFYHQDVSDAHTFRLIGYWGVCNASIEYVISDLGAVTASESSLGLHINSSRDVAGFDEDAAGDPGAWFSECGSFTSLGTLGGADGEALGINDAEEVVGWAHDGSGNRKAFTWTSGGGMTDLGTVSGRTDSEAAAINAGSEVVGTVLDFGVPPDNRLAFIDLPLAAYTLGAGMTSLGTFGGDESVAMDINDSGQVAGGAQYVSRNMRPFRWANGTMTDLGTLGGESISVLHRGQAINSSGNVVGLSYTAGGDRHAFYWDGSMSDLGVLTGGDTSWAFGINDSDEVVGTSNVTGGDFHAFVWDATNGLRDLNNLISGSWTLTRAVDINNNGLITGWGTNPSGDVRAFLLTPSCNNAGGGAAAAAFGGVMASGSGTTDGAGVFEGVVLDADGESLGEITILEADPDVTVEFEVVQPDDSAGAGLGPAPGTLEGFADGIAIRRTLMVETSAAEGNFIAIVSMTFFASELDDSAVDPEEVELHVLDTTLGPPPGVWVPAGFNIGESVPTGIVGDSGFEVYSDTTISFWAVRETVGIFAVGAAVVAQGDEMPPHDDDPGIADDAGPRVVPPVCGLGLVPFSLVALTMLIAIRRRQYGS
ncbi:MAG: hypothetical protein IIC02_06935 [Planctomycetes bacterium]|nr:hypothetical protein [Planctomycetota bacterium]